MGSASSCCDGCCCCCKPDAPPSSNTQATQTQYMEQISQSSHDSEAPLIKRRATPSGSKTAKATNPLIKNCANDKISTKDPLQLISGYENEPIVSLEEALQPFHDSISKLSNNITEAKRKCSRSSKHNLTYDESASIYIYTMHWEDVCVYNHLQKAWDSDKKERMKPWFKYLKLLKSALDKLPTVEIEVWQGAPENKILLEALDSRSLPLYSAMGLCLPNFAEIRKFLEDSDVKPILLGYKTQCVKSLKDYSVPGGLAYLLWPGAKVAVSDRNVESGTGCVFYHLTTRRK